MNLAEYNAYCASLPKAEHVVQWGGAHVWKIGGKVFAIAGGMGSSQTDPDKSIDKTNPFITFKCSDLSYDVLKNEPGFRPAPYLASRGMKWVQIIDHSVIEVEALEAYIRASYEMAIARLTKKARAEFGF